MRMAAKQYARLFGASAVVVVVVLLAWVPAGAEAGCVHVENQELLEYSCEGGSVSDLSQIPNDAEKIRISNMPVGRVAEDTFSRFGRSLVVLTCSHCSISDIDDKAFRRLESLQQLSLDNNQLTEVRAAWFEGLVYLTYLDLNYNAIERIDAAVFRNTPDLVDLRLSGNRLLCLDLESMSRLRDLKRIFINENPRFGCPNAVKKFLQERRIDFEADPHWDSLSQDRVRASEPLPEQPIPPAEERYPTTPPALHPRGRWTEAPPTPAPEPVTLPPPPPPPRRPTYAPPEMIQPSVPAQEFALQGPYYAPKMSQQQLDSYRNSLAQQAANAGEAAEAAQNRTIEAAEAARIRAVEAAEAARNRAVEAGETAQNRAVEAGEAARNRTVDALANATLPPGILLAGQELPPSVDCPNAAGLFVESRILLGLALALVALRWMRR